MITKKQKAVLDFITKYQARKEYAPSLDEIKKRFRLASVSTAHFHIKKLEGLGYLKKEHNKPRSIHLYERAGKTLVPWGAVADAPSTAIYAPTVIVKRITPMRGVPVLEKAIIPDNALPLNKIICGDAVEVMKTFPPGSIDLVVTSPPYDELRDYKGYDFDFKGIARGLFRVMKGGGVVVWVVGDETIKGDETGSSFRQALYFKECGFKLFDTMIYSKPPRGAVGNNKTYWQSFEYMFIFSKGNPKIVNLIKDRKNKESRSGDNGTKRLQNGKLLNLKRGGYGEFGRRKNIWEYNIGKGHSTSDSIAFEHPAIFPERLARDHIYTWSNKHDVVYDPMMGSGTVAKACILEERNYIGSDISEDYCNIAQKRISSMQKLFQLE